MFNMDNVKNCPHCDISWYDSKGYGRDMHCVEYAHPHPERYDGVSEFVCDNCHTRFGRWTGKVIPEGYAEPRYGRGGNPVKA
jgi:hypothetical protein